MFAPAALFYLKGIIMNYTIKHITTEAELDRALALDRRVFGMDGECEDSEYTREKWLSRIERDGEIMLYASADDASADDELIAIVFGRFEGERDVTVGPVATDARFRGKGIARSLMLRLEQAAKTLGAARLTLGAAESAEAFYAKLGYTGSLLIQSEKHSIDELLAHSVGHPVLYTNVWGGIINQICLALTEPDRELQRQYEHGLGDCWTQMMFSKNI